MPAETVVITGATAGVGRATARAFACRRARIGLLARGVDGLNATAAEVQQAGGEALALPTDVADADAVESAATAVERQFGPIDIWINCAMATIFAPLHEISPEEYRRATEVTYLGFVYGTMAALKRMRTRNRGTIVQVGSALAYRSVPLQAPYCGAKHAIRGFTDSLRSELEHEKSGIKLTMVQMPALNTPQFDWARNKMPRRPKPLGTIYEPEVAADAIVFGAHAGRREIYVGSATVEAILANKVVPGLLDRVLARRAVGGQLARDPAAPDAPDNLFTPVPGDHGAHGRFDAQAKRGSIELWLVKQRALLLAGGVGIAALAAAALLSGRSSAMRRLLAS
ncbi:MAG TPA: SDR family oxidoreductase [Stellaceae bacterium]|nr:SDR family oxidoreductase [Stellaceae bacterium]